MQKEMKRSAYERQTYVDRSSGVVNIFRGKPIKTSPIYGEPSRNRFPADTTTRNAVDNAHNYLEMKGYDKRASTSDLLKAAFAGGIFVGMSVMTAIGNYIGLI